MKSALPCLLVRLVSDCLFRRASVPGGRLQLLGHESATYEESAAGWVGSVPICEASAAGEVSLEQHASSSHDQNLVQQDALVPIEAAIAEQPGNPSSKSGRKRKLWEMHSTETVASGSDLRALAKNWVKEKGLVLNPFATSSSQGQKTLTAKCKD